MDIPDGPAVAAIGLSHRFGGTQALRYCSFEVPRGAVVAVLGRNGAGKSTLLRAVVGLLRPDGGRVEVFGRPVDAAALPRIGYLAQHAPLYPMLTVAQTVRLGARLNPRWDADTAQRVVDAARLPARAKVGSLSAGQRTPLAVAMALGKQPDLLVLDEPLAALDPISRSEVVGALMAAVADRGVTVLISSHVVADVEDVCDHLLVIGDGEVRLVGEAESTLAAHHIAVGAVRDLPALDALDVIEMRRDGDDFTALVRTTDPSGADTVTWHRPG